MDVKNILIIALGGGLDLLDSLNVSFMAELSERATLHRATTAEAALTAFATTSLTSVLVADPAVIGPRFKNVSTALVKFAREGGRVVFASLFVCDIAPPDFKKYFRSEWGLAWEMGQYSREVHRLQKTRSERLKARNSLPLEYSMKAAMVDGYKAGDAVYALNSTGTTDAAVVFAKFGRGYVGLNGDVNMEVESVLVNLALLNVSQASE